MTKIIVMTIIIQSTVHKNNGAHNELYNSSSEHKKGYLVCMNITTESAVVKSVCNWMYHM